MLCFPPPLLPKGRCCAGFIRQVTTQSICPSASWPAVSGTWKPQNKKEASKHKHHPGQELVCQVKNHWGSGADAGQTGSWRWVEFTCWQLRSGIGLGRNPRGETAIVGVQGKCRGRCTSQACYSFRRELIRSEILPLLLYNLLPVLTCCSSGLDPW